MFAPRQPTSMHRPAASTAVARAMATVGLLCGSAWIGWRATSSWSGSTLAVNAVLLVAEIVALIGSALLVWSFWNGPRPRPASWDHEIVDDIDVVIDAVGSTHQTHLIAASIGSVNGIDQCGQIVVACAPGELDAIAPLAAAMGATVRAIDPLLDPLVAAAGWLGEQYLFLTAGDVVHPDVLSVLGRSLSDPSVGAAQAETLIVADDRLARSSMIGPGDILHGPNGDDLDHFGRNTLNAALSAHGAAMITASGVLVRRAAVQRAVLHERGTASALTTNRDHHLGLSVALMAGGWTITHLTSPTGSPLVARQPEPIAARRASTRAEQALAHRQMVTAPFGVLRRRGMPLRQRCGVLAASVIGLGGVRRLALAVLLVASLIGGYVPFNPALVPLIAFWVPAFVLTPIALAVLSGWALRPGDRARASVRDLAATVTALTAPRAAVARRQLRMTDTRSTAWVVALIGVVATACTVRAVSERLTGALGSLPRPILEALYVAALWTVAIGCDCLRLLTRRGGQRRAQRLVTTTPASLGGVAAVVVDMTPLGVGVLTDHSVEVGAVLPMEFVVLADSGCTTVRLDGVVRNVRQADGGRLRVGVEFVEPSVASTIALTELTIVEPARRRLGARSAVAVEEGSTTIVDVRRPVSAVRRGARAAAMLTICGAVASVAPLQVRAGAVTAVSGVVSEQDTSVTVVTTCAQGPGSDAAWGTADDDGMKTERTSTSGSGRFSIDVVGQACWIAASADGTATTTWQVIDMNRASVSVDLPHPGTADVASLASRRPVPEASMLEQSDEPLGRSGFTLMALAFAVMLAGAVLLGIRQPLSSRPSGGRGGYSSGSSPDLAIR